MKTESGQGRARIVKIEGTVVRVPLDTPTSFATRQVLHRDYLLVRVHGDDGVSGIGFCYCGSNGGTIGAAAVRDLLAPVVVGQNPFRVEWLWKAMYDEALLHGRSGTVMRAVSAIDIAIWDRNARSLDLPLHRYLGAFAENSVPAYASGGYYLDGKTPQMLGDELAGYVAMGFKAVKMKVGRLQEPEEEERVAAARGAIGPDILLMLDANNAWSDLPTALRFMRRFEPYDPYWIEEPFSPDDIENHARLAASTPVCVATGEIEYGRWRFKELIEKGSAAILQADAAVCGGITEFRKIAATADSHGITVYPHWFHDLHVHLVAAIPNGRLVEFFPDDKVLNFRRLITRQLEVGSNGTLVLPQSPGLGFDFDAGAVEKWATDGWK